VEEGSRARGDVPAAVQHDLAQFEAELGAARFTPAHHRATLLLEPGREQGRLRGLARAVAALEGDEATGHDSVDSVEVDGRPVFGAARRVVAFFTVVVPVAFFAAGFLAAGFLAAGFLAAGFFAGAFLAGFFAGPFARLSARSCTARSKSTSSTVSPRGIVAFVVPSVTYGPNRPSFTLIGLPLSGSASNSFSA